MLSKVLPRFARSANLTSSSPLRNLEASNGYSVTITRFEKPTLGQVRVADADGATEAAAMMDAVSSANTLADGDVTLGTIVGNSGDWFELVVSDNNLDIRGWRMVMPDRALLTRWLSHVRVGAISNEIMNSTRPG